MEPWILKPGKLNLLDMQMYYAALRPIALSPNMQKNAKQKVDAARKIVQHYADHHKIAYGVNTGVGKLAYKIITPENIKALQRNLVLSHAAGTGPLLSEKVVRSIIVLKINCLIQGYSGVRWELIAFLINLLNHNILPCIPAKGSVGASGDLAPLAHLACTVIGEGEVFLSGKRLTAKKAFEKIGITPLVLEAKEALALLNGTQVSTALLVDAYMRIQKVWDAALYAGALSMIAVQGNIGVLDARIHALRRSAAQSEVAATLLALLQHNNFVKKQSPKRLQDPYSIRCQPQVMGACLSHLRYVALQTENEMNAITDNPLVFIEDEQILSGGNFHAQGIALGADAIATALATICNIAERRIALLLDENISGLPAFLVKKSGLNSGFMIAQVTAAALTSENKVLAHPASVDSIPTSANQEDHVSMATFAAKRLEEMSDNTATVVAIELLSACQGIDLLPEQKLTGTLREVYSTLREKIAFYESDRYFASDIACVKEMIDKGAFTHTKAQCRIW